MKRTIRLKGVNATYKGREWESSELLRIGRLETLEVVLDDTSVSRNHAEIRATDRGWRIRDLGSTNGTRINGVRMAKGQSPLRPRDLLQFGEIAMIVETIDEGADLEPLVATEELRVEGITVRTWDEATQSLAFDTNHVPRADAQLLALLRAGHHLGHIEKEDELLQSILQDAVRVLDAQRGAIVLAEGAENLLKLKALVTGQNEPRALVNRRADLGGRIHYSHSLAMRSFQRGESILCHRVDDDPELAAARSIAEGSMASVLCVVLRTPRKRLGVLHLDRSPWQKPFTMEDLYLADGLAANVSAGIESAQLLRKQRDLFLDTITILAQAVELRDEYTGGHTLRVSSYSVMLALELDMSARDVELIRLGTPLHDFGKIGISDAILNKAGRLTPEEFELMKTHTVMGANFFNTVPDLRPIIPIVRSHHERWDGLGYPDGLAGEAIPALARVVALADSFDAMTSNRPYRKGMTPDAAFAEIEKWTAKQFDPRFAKAFLGMRESIFRELEIQTTDSAIRRKGKSSGQVLLPVRAGAPAT